MKRMQDRVVLITGAASGIGAACSRLFAKEGATVIATDIQTEQGKTLAEEVKRQGGHLLFLKQDVTKEDDWQKTAEQILERYGSLHVLVNNAGIAMPGNILTYSLDEWRRVFAVNAESVFLGTRYCLPHLAASGAGAIVNMSSAAGITGLPGASAYSATKGAVRLFTKAVAKECAAGGLKVRCNSVHPGVIDTPIWDSLPENPEAQEQLAAQTEQSNQSMVQMAADTLVPGGQVGQPSQVAEAVLFLASDASDYINGAELSVDYGWTA